MEHDAGIRQPWPIEHLGETDVMDRTSAYVACTRNDSALLDQVIAKDTRMLTSVHEWFNISPLDIAVRRGFVDPLVKMKQHDHEDFRKSVFTKDRWDMSVMHFAVESGRANIVKFLLDHLPPLDLVYARDCYNRIPLHLAARGGHMEVVDLLLKVDPSQRNAVDDYGETPSYHATEGGHTHIQELLEPYDEPTSSSGDTTENGLTLLRNYLGTNNLDAHFGNGTTNFSIHSLSSTLTQTMISDSASVVPEHTCTIPT
jgi:hypothetical protein